MAGESKTTTDHEEIKRWVEERGGKPSIVRGTEDAGEGAGLLRINFPGCSGTETLEEVSWEEFFQTFEEKNLAFYIRIKQPTEKRADFLSLSEEVRNELNKNF